MDDISVYGLSGKELLIEDGRELREAVSFDEDYLYVDSEKLRLMLDERKVTDPQFVILYGGFYKLPGYGGGGGCEILDRETLEQDRLQMPNNMADDLLLWIYKQL